ncbi:MAG: 50S ribosomal protein L21, partial [Cyanobacteria bacterium REEB65]|nr:50S ribosomal protein L21 [Cyanobacteria bacterium REEB65]
MYAIIATGGKQVRVEEGRYVDVEKIAGDEGAKIEFGEVLLVSGDDLKIGSPTVPGAKVVGTIQSQWKGPKVIVYKMRP